MKFKISQESFLKDVAIHEMQIFRDDETYRHLRFKRPGTVNMYFDITTWPGFLCYSGDMGCYVFTRLHDMFAFFRMGSDPGNDRLDINPQYWGQKVEAIDRCSPIQEYDPDTFRDNVCAWTDEREASQAVRREVVLQVLSHADDGEHEAIRAALEFEHDGFRFDEFYEVSCKEYSHRFLWCCYAIAWGIRQYDRWTAEPKVEGNAGKEEVTRSC